LLALVVPTVPFTGSTSITLPVGGGGAVTTDHSAERPPTLCRVPQRATKTSITAPLAVHGRTLRFV
jgi:hypothetical protein